MTDQARDDCAWALQNVYRFLDREIDAETGDAIRQHLAACEPCLEHFDVEAAVKALVHRCCGGEQAPSTLRARVLIQFSHRTADDALA